MISNELRLSLIKNGISRISYKEPLATAYEEIDYPFHYREQMPNLIRWIEENKQEYLMDTRCAWIRQHIPHILS